MPRAGASQLLIHAVGPVWSWASMDAEGRVVARGQCDPDRPDWPDGLAMHVLVDARACTGLSLDLPELSGARLEQAVRWAAEEYLAGAADEEHVVPAGRSADGRMRCVVVAEATMADWVERLGATRLHVVCPDALCLPWAPGRISLGRAGGSILMRWGEWEFGSFDLDMAREVLASAAAEGAVRVWYGGDVPADFHDDQTMQVESDSLIDALAPAARKPMVNLLSGAWRPVDASSASRNWRWVAGLATAVALVAVTTLAVERQLLRSESASLQVAIDERFSQAFPGVTPAGRHRELAERELARLRFGQSAGLLDLMRRTSPVVSGQSGLSVEGLSFRDGQLELRVRAADVAGLDELEQRLRAVNLDAAVQSASLDAQGASGRLRVGERSG